MRGEVGLAAVGEAPIAIAEVIHAARNHALRLRARHVGIRSHARVAASTAMRGIRLRIHLASGLRIHVAIEVVHDALRELASARHARRNRLRRFARIAACSAMLETHAWIRFTTVLIKVVAVFTPIRTARYGTLPTHTRNIRIGRRGTSIVTRSAMLERRRVGLALRRGISITLGKSRWTSTALSPGPTRCKIAVCRRTRSPQAKSRQE